MPTLYDNQYIFHAGTKISGEKFFSTGGRVLNFVSIDDDLKLARINAIKLIKKPKWMWIEF